MTRRQSRTLTALEPPLSIAGPKTRANSSSATRSSAQRAKAQVDELVAKEGAESAAARLAWSFESDRPEQLVAMEAVTAYWAKSDPVAASQWLIEITGVDGQTDGMLESDVWEAAVSGYIEGIADEDPETAVSLAGLLSPGRPTSQPETGRDRESPAAPALPVDSEIAVADPEPAAVTEGSVAPDLEEAPSLVLWIETLRRLREIHGFE